MESASIEDRLATNGRWRELARRTLEQASEDLPALAREALAAGISKSEIARRAQVSRVTLDSMLKQTTG